MTAVQFDYDVSIEGLEMARRNRSGSIEDLVDVIAMLPWWVGFALALTSYLVLHGIASQEDVGAAQPGQLGAMIGRMVWMGFASVGQYVLPLICLGGAGISAWRRKTRRNLAADVAQSKSAGALNEMNWREFEMLVGEGFRLQGYRVVETGQAGADGGVDLVLTKTGKNGSEKFLVQCKQWRALKVGVDVVRELYGVMAATGATGGFVVTSGRFTDEAIAFADGRSVKLVDGPKLHGLIQQARSKAAAAPSHQTAGAPAVQPDPSPVQAATCPVCSRPMARRTARRGARAGSEFWGCTGYPACRGTRTIG